MSSIGCTSCTPSDAAQGTLMTQIQFAVASKQLDAVRQQGDALQAMLQDVARLGKALDRGAQLDELA